jgi:hypothetical protein
MSHWDFGQPTADQDDEPRLRRTPAEDDGWGEAGDAWDEGDDDIGPYPLTYERDPAGSHADGPGRDVDEGGGEGADDADTAADFAGAWPGWEAGAWPELEDGGRPRRSRSRSGSRSGRRRALPAGIAVAAAAVSAGSVLLAASPGGGSARPSGAGGGTGTSRPSVSASASAPLSLAQAQAVLAAYTAGNNTANAQRSETRLATLETGSSYAIDSAMYRAEAARNATPYPPFRPLRATYYLPRNEPRGGPRWFAVKVANVFDASPAMVTSTEYLLFTQAVAGGPWLNAVEPYLRPRSAAADIAVGPDGLATAVSPASTTDAVLPGQLPAQTAASLDVASAVATGAGTARPDGSIPPGVSTTGLSSLADQADLRRWHKDVPGGTVTDVHAVAPGAAGQAFALRTTDGGALVFYTDAASVTVTAPPGAVLHIALPGSYSPAQPVTQAAVSYLEQFAAYDPPAGDGVPRVIADYSDVTGGT